MWPESTLNCPAIRATCLAYQRTSVMVTAGPCFVRGVDWASRCWLASCAHSLPPSTPHRPVRCTSPDRRTAVCDRPRAYQTDTCLICETVTSPVPETASPRDSERRESLHLARHRESMGHLLALTWEMIKR